MLIPLSVNLGFDDPSFCESAPARIRARSWSSKGLCLTCEVRTLLIDYWMGHASGEMAGRYGKQLLDNVQWRQECAANVGLGFTLEEPNNSLLDKSGQVFEVEIAEAVSA